MKTIANSLVKRLGYQIVKLPASPRSSPAKRLELAGPLSVAQLVEASSAYIESLKVLSEGELKGYKFASSCDKEALYAVVSVLLLKHLTGVPRENVSEELNLVKRAQTDSGLFFDPAMNTPMAEKEDWWGWRHLSFLALMALGLYGEVPQYEVDALPELHDELSVRKLVNSADWNTLVAYTSNRLQNFGVMLQVARDFQNSSKAKRLMQCLLESIADRIAPDTGLFGDMPCKTPQQKSEHIQAGYHLWLLFHYDGLDIPHFSRAIETVLQTQNICGGFGIQWNSSCCEDIDSIDPLYRYARANREAERCLHALELGLTSVLRSLNADGGFVFRRGKVLRYGDAAVTWAGVDESCLLFTWFRLLSIAYVTEALGRGLAPSDHSYTWTWGRAPGLQFL